MSHSRSSLELAAARVLKACGPVVDDYEATVKALLKAVQVSPGDTRTAECQARIDEVRGALMDLARALEVPK